MATALLILVIAAPRLSGTDATSDKVDKLFATWDKTTSPGAAHGMGGKVTGFTISAGRAAGIEFSRDER